MPYSTYICIINLIVYKGILTKEKETHVGMGYPATMLSTVIDGLSYRADSISFNN